MNIEITWKGGGRTIDVPAPDESAVMEEAGKALLEIDEFPNSIKVECDSGTAEFTAVKRGTFVDADGHDRPSIHCSCSYWNMRLPESRYRNAVLTCVNARKSRDTGRSANNYKRYDLVPVNGPGGSTRYVDAYYGRLDSFLPGCENEPYGKRKVQQPYKPYMYWMIYYEKISKGYVDNTAQYCGPVKTGKGKAAAEQGTPATPSEKLYAKLMSFSRQLVQSTFAAPVDEAVTQAQAKKARKYFNAMCQRKTVEGFNRQLEQLVMLSPRNVAYTSSLFAYDRDDFAAIIDREETLLNAMEAMLTGMESGSGEAAKLPSFADFGMDVFADSDEDAIKKAREMLIMHVYGIDLGGMEIKEARYFAWDCLTSYDLFSYILSDSRADNHLAGEVEKDKQKMESLEEMTGVLARDVLSQKKLIDDLLEAVINGRTSEEKYRLLQKIYGYLDEEVYDTLLKMEEGCTVPGGADEKQVSDAGGTTSSANS